MKTEHKNNQHGQGAKADSKQTGNQHPSKKSTGLDNEQEYSLDDKTSKRKMTGNADKKKSDQSGKYPVSGDTATMADDDDDATEDHGHKEYDDTDHQHDYKTPVNHHNHNENNQNKNSESHHDKNGNHNR